MTSVSTARAPRAPAPAFPGTPRPRLSKKIKHRDHPTARRRTASTSFPCGRRPCGARISIPEFEPDSRASRPQHGDGKICGFEGSAHAGCFRPPRGKSRRLRCEVRHPRALRPKPRPPAGIHRRGNRHQVVNTWSSSRLHLRYSPVLLVTVVRSVTANVQLGRLPPNSLTRKRSEVQILQRPPMIVRTLLGRANVGASPLERENAGLSPGRPTPR